MLHLQPISLHQIPFQTGVFLFAAAWVWSLFTAVSRYPRLARFASLYTRDLASGCLLNLRVVIFGWGTLLLLAAFSTWSLFRFAQLINFLFARELQLIDKLVAVALPLVYALIPLYALRLTVALVLLSAPRDYWARRPPAEGPAADVLEAFGQDPRFAGHWAAIDAALSLIVLLFTPAAIKRIYELGVAGWGVFLLGLALLFAVFALGVRLEGSRLRDLALSLGKAPIALGFLTLAATLREVDPVEVSFFALLGLWVLVAALVGTPAFSER